MKGDPLIERIFRGYRLAFIPFTQADHQIVQPADCFYKQMVKYR